MVSRPLPFFPPPPAWVGCLRPPSPPRVSPSLFSSCCGGCRRRSLRRHFHLMCTCLSYLASLLHLPPPLAMTIPGPAAPSQTLAPPSFALPASSFQPMIGRPVCREQTGPLHHGEGLPAPPEVTHPPHPCAGRPGPRTHAQKNRTTKTCYATLLTRGSEAASQRCRRKCTRIRTGIIMHAFENNGCKALPFPSLPPPVRPDPNPRPAERGPNLHPPWHDLRLTLSAHLSE